jgi:hypothetical protein
VLKLPLLLLLLAGKTLVRLEGNAQVSRSNETNLGNYVCEAFLKSVPAAVTAQTGSISICLMVAGGIRTGIDVSRHAGSQGSVGVFNVAGFRVCKNKVRQPVCYARVCVYVCANSFTGVHLNPET